MTLLVRDEEDIVRSNIEFHLSRGVDFVIAMDNLSVDRTPQILREYEAQGRLRYIQQLDDDYSQHRWVTDMARLAHVEHGADWVINNDADEFWWPADGDLKQVLASAAASCNAMEARRVNFPAADVPPGAFFADVMTVRESRSFKASGAPLSGKVCHRASADIEVAQGNHAVRFGGRAAPAARAPITILHFPMRSYRQFANKIAKGGAAYGRNTSLEPAAGGAWRRLHRLYEAGELEAYYRSLIPDEATMEEGLRSGRFVSEDRLKRALSDLDH